MTILVSPYKSLALSARLAANARAGRLPLFQRRFLFFSLLCAGLFAGLSAGMVADGQEPVPAATAAPADKPAEAPQTQPPGTDSSQATSPAPAAQATPPTPVAVAEGPGGEGAASPFSGVTEEELRRQLVGKPLFLRGGYLGDSLSFNEHGAPTGHPAVGSYTLSAVQIEKVRLTKHKIELEGARYGLHFLGALPSEDPEKAVDRVKITPKKKVLKITIDREQVVKPKKVKEEKKKPGKPPVGATATPAADTSPAVASSETDTAPAAAGGKAAQPAAEEAKPGTAAEAAANPEAETPAEQAAEPASVTTTTSPAHAAMVLRQALGRVFAQGLDEQVRGHMPQFWQLYYQAQAAGTDYRTKDSKVLRSNAVDQQAKLASSIAPDSNEYAQANGIAGRALYRAVVGADGKPSEIAVIRPIGFGLDENAVAAILKASFQPALKDGQPVAESLDLVVLFRIYSKRTSVAAGTTETGTPAAKEPVKPGPYSVKPQQQ